MRFLTVLFTLLVAVLPAAAQGFDAADFYKEVMRHGDKYTRFSESEEARQLLAAGDLAIVHQRLLQLVPDAEKTGYDYFSLGNIFFNMDEALSLELMKKADAVLPNNPAVLMELGMLEHRRGHCDIANGYYEKFRKHAMAKLHAPAWAYATDCYLRTGKYKEAIKVWEKAEFRQHHIGIEKGMYQIYGGPSPEVERARLLDRIKAGEHALLCRLHRLDANWEVDWWNAKPQDDYLRADQALADRLLAKDATARDGLALCTGMNALSDKEFAARMETLGFWGKQKRLPASPDLTYLGIERLLKAKQASNQEIFDAFEEQLLQRQHEQPKEQKYLDLLAYLYSQLGLKEKLEKVDLQGWHELKLEKYATSYLAGRNPEAPDFPALLEAALRDFPNSDMLNKEYLRRNLNGPGKPQALASFAASRFALVGKPDTYRLSDYMASFEHLLKK